MGRMLAWGRVVPAGVMAAGRFRGRKPRFAPRAGMRCISDCISGVSPDVNFRRVYAASTMNADAVVSTLREMTNERSGDVFLLRALSHRFLAHVEEFFPPQIIEVLQSCADLGFADERLLQGLVGRIEDVTSGASPRRVVRILRCASALQLPPEAWLDSVLPPLYRHIPNLREGVPSALGHLAALRCTDPELIELLLSQGQIVSEELGDGYFSRVFERWSRHGQQNGGAVEQATTLAAAASESPRLAMRDALNLLAGLRRSGGKEHELVVNTLEEHLEARLRAASPGETVDALEWMERLSLQSPLLLKCCGDQVEMALSSMPFVRSRLPGAVHSLAALADSQAQRKLVVALLRAGATKEELPRYNARQSAQFLNAACLVAAACKPNSEEESKLVTAVHWADLLLPTSRLSRKLTLPDRRAMRRAAISLQDLNERIGLDFGDSERKALEWLRELPVASLPPLGGLQVGEGWRAEDIGTDSVLRPPGDTSDRSGVRMIGPLDMFTVPRSPKAARVAITPTCQLAVRAIELQGWKVTLQL